MLVEWPAWTLVTVNCAVAECPGMLATSLPDVLMLITGADAATTTTVAVNPPEDDVVMAPEVTVSVPVDECKVIPTPGQNPDPVMVTVVPDGPLVGLRVMEGAMYGLQEPAPRAGTTRNVPEMARRTARTRIVEVFFVFDPNNSTSLF